MARDNSSNDPPTDGSPNDRMPPTGARGRARRKDPLGPESEIGARLRALYAEVEREPIPSQLVDLLDRLSAAEAKAGR